MKYGKGANGEKVPLLPGKFVPFNSLKSNKCEAISTSFDSGHPAVVIISRTRKIWTLIDTGYGGNASVEGVLGGMYSVNARGVAHQLADLGVWSQKDADDFNTWFYETDRRESEDSKIEKAKELLAHNGYDVTVAKR